MKWAHSTAVSDVPVFIDHVETFRPSRVGVFRGVAHVVDAERQWVFEASDEIVGNIYALLQVFWLRVTHIVFYVGLHLPLVGGMRFAHVNGQEVGVILVIFVNLRDVAYLAAKRGSGKTA